MAGEPNRTTEALEEIGRLVSMLTEAEKGRCEAREEYIAEARAERDEARAHVEALLTCLPECGDCSAPATVSFDDGWKSCDAHLADQVAQQCDDEPNGHGDMRNADKVRAATAWLERART